MLFVFTLLYRTHFRVCTRTTNFVLSVFDHFFFPTILRVPQVKNRTAMVKYMFFNPEDIEWFKPLELWTKHGLVGE